MKTSYSAGFRCFSVLLSTAFISSANPITPQDMPVLAEIQVTDSLHWSVEVDLSRVQGWLLTYPCSTDTFLLFFQQSGSLPPNDSMRHPVIHEVFDANGIAVLTPQHFPGLKLIRGSYVFLRMMYSTSYGYTWSTQISTYHTAQQSIVGGLYQTCCEYGGPTGCIFVCPKLGYQSSFCSSIGIQNDKALGSITGHVRGADSQLLANIRVNVTKNPASGTSLDTTNGSGLFSFSSLDRCHTYSLRFTDTAGTPISDTVIGPLSIIMGGTINVEVLLNYRPSSVSPRKTSPMTAGSVRLLSPKIRGQIPLAVSGSFAGQGTIDIFSANGSLIRSLLFACRGPGTYTVSWDGCDGTGRLVLAGKYICRVKLGEEVSCKDFIAW